MPSPRSLPGPSGGLDVPWKERLLAVWAGRLLAAGRAGLDLLLPPHCPTCPAIVDRQGSFCDACFARASFIGAPCCTRCAVPFGADAGPSVMSDAAGAACAQCRRNPPPWRQARAAFAYEGLVRDLVLPLKYADRTENAAILARHMARVGGDLLARTDLLVPVPLHRRRLFGRRYNQAALIAGQLARLSGRTHLVDALRRPNPTGALAGQDARAREATMAAAIVANPKRLGALAGQAVLLIDDVLTTGATARACAASLLAAGATRVDLLVAARTVRDPTATER